MKIPIPPCNNNRRTTMKCRRMCCKRKRSVATDTTKQTVLTGGTRPSMKIQYWSDYAKW